MDPIIEFTNVSLTYADDKTTALHDISFSVNEGEFVCFIGASGSGKTTTLKLIAGLEEPTEGMVKKPAVVAMSFQFGALFPWLTVFDNVALGLRQKGITGEHLTREVDKQLRMVGIFDFKSKYPSELSGGQRQRVGIARALAVDPVVLLLDEPFSALDAKTTAELHDDIIKIWHETGKTIIMVSHLIEEAVSLAGRVMLFRNGTIDMIYSIDLPYPRREQAEGFMRDTQHIRRAFFK